MKLFVFLHGLPIDLRIDVSCTFAMGTPECLSKLPLVDFACPVFYQVFNLPRLGAEILCFRNQFFFGLIVHLVKNAQKKIDRCEIIFVSTRVQQCL